MPDCLADGYNPETQAILSQIGLPVNLQGFVKSAGRPHSFSVIATEPFDTNLPRNQQERLRD